jgi:hypothetical protein
MFQISFCSIVCTLIPVMQKSVVFVHAAAAPVCKTFRLRLHIHRLHTHTDPGILLRGIQLTHVQRY